jgi:hypothetical protein
MTDETDLHVLRLIVRDLVWLVGQQETSAEHKDILQMHLNALDEIIGEDDFEKPDQP